MSSQEPDTIINLVKRITQSDQRSDLRLNANGGNSILVVCDPLEELNFIGSIHSILDKETFGVADLNKLLMDFIDDNISMLDQMFDLRRGSVNQIFKAPPEENTDDLFSRIIGSIASILDESRIPVLINTGALFGAGIDNIQIIENETVMNAAVPIVILYPATYEDERLNFLGQRPASRYRCMIIP